MSLAEFIDTHLAEPAHLDIGDGGPSSASGDAPGASGGSSSRNGGGGGGKVPIGYLAQHPLFEQLPNLRRDFSVPPCCSVGSLQHVNAWLGPAGTVTPLHFDSYDNVLTQACGYKRVRLYPASQTPNLYVKAAGGDGLDAQGNVSAVDIEAPDLARFPDFAKAEGCEAVIGPGDGLFIPAGCWHHVRSLSTAFSVSFWF